MHQLKRLWQQMLKCDFENFLISPAPNPKENTDMCIYMEDLM